MPGVSRGGGSPAFAFSSPDVLTTTDNALIPWLPGNGDVISSVQAVVKTAPTGQAVIVLFKTVNLTTGVVGATLGTATIAVSTFDSGITAITPATIAAGSALAMEISQVGSGVAGSNLTGVAR